MQILDFNSLNCGMSERKGEILSKRSFSSCNEMFFSVISSIVNSCFWLLLSFGCLLGTLL